MSHSQMINFPHKGSYWRQTKHKLMYHSMMPQKQIICGDLFTLCSMMDFLK